MSNILKFRLSGLWNSEYPLVVNRIIDIVGAHDPQTIHLGQSFDRLDALRPQLAKIEVQERLDQDSKLLSELDQQRDTLYNIMYTVTKTFQRAPIAEISDNAHSVMNILKKHKSDIPNTNYTAETERISDLVADISSKFELVEAIAKMSLAQVFERMSEVNIEFDSVFMQRNQRQAEREKIDIRAIRQECDTAINLLWNAIEFCCHEYGETNYLPMINIINNLNGYYKQQLASRSARRKAKQNVANEEPILELRN